jgi:hypothetical protein
VTDAPLHEQTTAMAAFSPDDENDRIPVQGQLPRLRFSPRKAPGDTEPQPGGNIGRLLRAGGAAALAMGSAAAVVALAGDNRKGHGRKANGNKAGAELQIERSTRNPEADGSDGDHEDVLHDKGGSRLGEGAARLAKEAAGHLHAVWQGPDNLTLSIQQVSRVADSFLDCQDILAGNSSAIWEEYLGYTRRALQMNLAHLQALTHCRSPQDLSASQADLFVKQVDLSLRTGLRIADLSAGAASRTVHVATNRKSRRSGP